jgi:hypothetical protein
VSMERMNGTARRGRLRHRFRGAAELPTSDHQALYADL